ncbi:MAG TPA: AAA family ATPase, partial [Candidatus Diapherotrites archaeon]|nr:AAA family ATPase [Candidatus Diapherotrites archaeon]
MLFHGHTGSGKTLLAEITARENAWELFELNASDFRTKDIIERIAGAAALNSSFSGKLRLVLLDEVDGLQGTADKGGAAAIGSLLRQASQPVILTANEIYGDAGKKLS